MWPCQPSSGLREVSILELASPERRPGFAVNEQSPDVWVAALTDAKERRLTTGRVLFRDQAEPGGEISCLAKLPTIAHSSQKRRGAKRPDSRHSDQRSGRFICAGERFELPTDLCKPLL